MTTKTINELDLVEDLDLRNKYIERVEVLENVKGIITLPNTELITTRMVAEYYEVSQDVIRKNIERNKSELTNNGMKFMSYGEIKEELNSDLMSQLKISRQGSNIFSYRALLNMGMLLRDSKIAQEVRNQLLNGFEKLTEEQKVYDINEEDKLLLAVMKADNQVEQAIAVAELNNYKNRHIAYLNAQIEEQKPKVSYCDNVLKSTSTVTTTQIAKDYGLSAVSFNKKLNELGVQYKQSSQWLLYSKYQDKGYTQSDTYLFGDNQSKLNTKWTQTGRLFLYELLKDNEVLPLMEKGLTFGEELN